MRTRGREKLGKCEIVFGQRDIALIDKNGYQLYWHETEWIDEPQTLFSIVNAVILAAKGKDIRRTVTLQP